MSGVFDQQLLSKNGLSIACTTSEKRNTGANSLKSRFIGAARDRLTGENFIVDRTESDRHLHLSFLPAVKCMDLGLD